MSIEEIAQAVAAEWQMSFDGIELDFALEVAKRAVAEEREACAKVCDVRSKRPNDGNWTSDGWDTICRENKLAADDIRTRSNTEVSRPAAPAAEVGSTAGLAGTEDRK